MKKKVLTLLLLIFLGIIYVIPQILLHSFNLLDFIETISLSNSNHSFIETISQLVNDQSRFRPIFILYRYLLNNYLTGAPQYFIAIGIKLGLTLYFSIRIVSFIHRQEIKATLFFLFLVLFSPVTVDSYWRLGTAENLLVLFLLISLYLLITGRYLSMMVFLLLFLLSKETSIFFIPLFVTTLFLMKRYAETLLLLIISHFYVINLIPRVQESSQGYTSLFTVSIEKNIDILARYFGNYPQVFFPLIISTLLFFYLFFKQNTWDKKKRTNLLILLTGSYSSLLSILFFNNIQAYYLLPYLFLVGITLVGMLALVNSVLIKKILYILLFIVVLLNYHDVIERVNYWQRDYAADAPLISYLQNKDDKKYYIDPENRIDHIQAIQYLLGDRSRSSLMQADYIITRYETKYGSNKKNRLCGETLFKERMCKWYIVTNRLDTSNK